MPTKSYHAQQISLLNGFCYFESCLVTTKHTKDLTFLKMKMTSPKNEDDLTKKIKDDPTSGMCVLCIYAFFFAFCALANLSEIFLGPWRF